MDSSERAVWLREQGRVSVKGGPSITLRRWVPKENTEILGKFKYGWIELRGFPFHLYGLRIIFDIY